MDRSIDDEESLNLSAEKTEDIMFLRRGIKQYHDHKQTELRKSYSKRQSEVYNNFEVSFSQKCRIIKDEKYFKILKDSMDTVHPLIYLNTEQRKMMMDRINICRFDQKQVLYSGMEDNLESGNWASFVLLEGEIHIFNKRSIFWV